MTELINQSLGPFCLFHDSLSVILPNGSAEFVVVHGRAVFPFPPQASNSDRILDLEDALIPV